jgi:superfamily II DNA or RNA helicase
MNAKPGSLVKYREREWVVMPSEDQQIVLLRPIGGSARETCGVLKPLSNIMGYSLPFERISETQFPLPDSSAIRDLASVKLTIESARLLLRDGAAPFRSPGHLSIRPRPYQFVPLIMALRLDTVRLLIADDVGIGKTIEAGLIARELLDRGDIKRIAVLCPPYLCDQWQRELSEKFHIDAVVIRSGTVSRLERLAPQDVSIFKHNRHFIASIDTVKGEGYRNGFLTHCPELVIVDEAHGSAQPPSGRQSYAQQQRHELLRDLAKDADRNIMLLTATPHSGIEESFKSILGLLKPEFRNYNLSAEKDRIELAKYFVQRRRVDIKRWLGEDTPFPERDETNLEQPYKFSDEYKRFYDRIYGFAHDIISSAEALTGWRKRMRFWSALALLRCVTSSPASAKATLLKRLIRDDEQTSDTIETLTDEELDASFRPVVSDPMEAEAVIDTQPSSIFDAQEQDPSWKDSDRRRLREFANEADKLYGNADNKLLKLISILTDMLKNGYNPIVWCRYIATAEYVADEVRNRLSGRFSNLKVASITGTLSEDDRKLKMDELTKTLTE